MRSALLVFALAGLCTPGGALAGSLPSSATAPAPPLPHPDGALGERTRNWLDLQRSGAEAGPRRPMHAGAAELAYQRYLQSFTHPIPEQFSVEGRAKEK